MKICAKWQRSRFAKELKSFIFHFSSCANVRISQDDLCGSLMFVSQSYTSGQCYSRTFIIVYVPMI